MKFDIEIPTCREGVFVPPDFAGKHFEFGAIAVDPKPVLERHGRTIGEIDVVAEGQMRRAPSKEQGSPSIRRAMGERLDQVQRCAEM